ncbi:glycosyltransferase family 2 protein, partial [Candidatus Gottesmanbacteria bacterium]|nr:glycosyltransferase family 2 protein [Candidatus Gottesmanbacteria bacterium]
MKPRISIIIPAVHEEKTIGAVLAGIRKHVRVRHEVIVVNDDDGKDGTKQVVSDFARRHPEVTLIRKQKTERSGFAAALSLGLRQAQGEYMLPIMADGCDRYEDIDALYIKAQEGWDIVSGSRYVQGAKKSGGPLLQSIFSRFICWVAQVLTGIPTHDVSNSFKLYKSSLVKRLGIDVAKGTEISMDLALRA